MQQRKVILYIAMSLDGFIAGENDNLDFLSTVEVPDEDYGYSDFTNTVDTVIMGRKTYDKVMSFGVPFPHAEPVDHCLPRTARGTSRPAITSYCLVESGVAECHGSYEPGGDSSGTPGHDGQGESRWRYWGAGPNPLSRRVLRI